MARSRLCRVCGDWHDLSMDWPEACHGHFKTQSAPSHGLATPMVNFDTMNPVQSQTNGKMYDSKSALRSEYRRAGVIELGNERIKPKPKPTEKQRRTEIRQRLERAAAKVGI